ncbi:MAG: hypothetical protein LBL35_03170 [Clostridiales bacterium]|jgi:cell wall-associated NlpC family hydrolase|nr:hypothetical protein [Clostridiales bacterium]
MKMTRLTKTFRAGAMSIVTLLSANAAVSPVLADSLISDIDTPVVSIPITPVNGNLRSFGVLSYDTDIEGNIYGPEDFSIDGSDSYLLNSTSNTVLKFVDGSLEDVVELNEIPAVRIAAGDGDLFVLGSDLTISKFGSDGDGIPAELGGVIENEAVTDFKAINGYLYLTTAEGDWGKTYKIPAGSAYGNIGNIETIDGKVLDENTTYRVELLPEDGYSVGHACSLTVNDSVTGQTNSALLISDYWVIGAQLLGVDDAADTYTVKFFEMAVNSDYTTSVDETIRVVSQQGNIESIRSLPAQYKSVSGQTKAFDSGIYELNSEENIVEIAELAIPSQSDDSVASYVSPLAAVSEPVVTSANSSVFSRAAMATISRSAIIANAKVYHTAFSWSCTAANLSAMSGYTKPRCLGSAGTYQMMPYCWGGFNTTGQFVTGLSAGGRAGNINTSGPGLVSNTYGLDCSGYVSRAWGLTSKQSTSSLPNISTAISASALQQGDILNLAGSHVVLFEKYDSGGNYVLYEATTTSSYDRVANTIRTASSISNYTPRKYNDVQ